MQKISAVIITLNEEKNIERCVRAAQEVADEILIIDSNSTDRTAEIATAMGCQVFQQKWLGYAEQKNWGNEQSQHDYILSLDADEVLDDTLIRSIKREQEHGLNAAYSMNRLTNYCGYWIRHSGWYPDTKVRLFPKSQVSWTGEFVHESLAIPNALRKQHLNGDLLHYSYNTLDEHRERASKYADLAAQKMHANGKQVGPLKPWLSGFAKFVSMYFFKLGFLDGQMGIVLAWISAQGNVYRYQQLRKMNK